ncbi:MAG: DUF4160 domain-containing protein [Pseudomonadales bacterium]
MHVHIRSQDGEAKYWLEPRIELAKNYRLSQIQLRQIEAIVEAHRDELVRRPGKSTSEIVVTDISPDGLWVLIVDEEHFLPFS